MSFITTSGSKSDRRYRARWRTPDGESRSKTFTRKIDAEQHLASVTVSAAEGAYVDPGAGRRTFGAYAASWAAAQPHRPATADGVETILRVHVLPTFGHRPIASIRTSEIQAWVAGLELAPSTVAVVYGKVAAIFRSAVEDRVIARSPCTRGVRLPRKDGGEVVPMPPGHVATMVEAVGPRYRALVVLLAGTGLRPGEALGLTVDRVNFLKRTIRVDRQLVTLPNAEPVHAPVKTPSSVRTIPAPQSVLDELASHIDRYPPGVRGLIFTNAEGGPIRRNGLGHVWRRAAARVGVEGVTPHDLRHYCATVMIASGASVKAVQRHLGHRSATTTLDVYSHLWPESEDVTRQALEAGVQAFASHPRHDVSAVEQL